MAGHSSRSTAAVGSGRIVLLTGHPNVREITASLGADAYVGKPFELTELLRELEQQLGRAIG
jgi:DNA-binding response OmpR family regulator